MPTAPAAVGPVGIGLNVGAVGMDARDRLLRRLGIGAKPGFGLKSIAAQPGLLCAVLPMLMLGGMTLAAQARYQLQTEISPDGTLTLANGVCPTGTLTIPEAIEGERVTRIGDPAPCHLLSDQRAGRRGVHRGHRRRLGAHLDERADGRLGAVHGP